MMIICKSWEKQVLENTKDIEELQNNVESDVSEINQQLARALKTPIGRPSSTELVAVDDTNTQVMLELGDGLAIQDDKLTVTGGAAPDILLDITNETGDERELSFSWTQNQFVSYAGSRRTLLLKGLANASNPYIDFITTNPPFTVDYTLYDENGYEEDGGNIKVTRNNNTLSLSGATKTVFIHMF